MRFLFNHVTTSDLPSLSSSSPLQLSSGLQTSSANRLQKSHIFTSTQRREDEWFIWVWKVHHLDINGDILSFQSRLHVPWCIACGWRTCERESGTEPDSPSFSHSASWRAESQLEYHEIPHHSYHMSNTEHHGLIPFSDTYQETDFLGMLQGLCYRSHHNNVFLWFRGFLKVYIYIWDVMQFSNDTICIKRVPS